MSTTVYISSERIEVLCYTKAGGGVLVKEYVTAPLPEGVMLSGRIIDNAAIIDVLSELKRNYPAMLRNASLTVDGSAVLLKRLAVPKLTKKQYYRLVKDELSDDSIEFVCDYQSLNKTEGAKSILACAMEKSLIERYIQAFKSAGIKLSSIRIGVQAVQNYINSDNELKRSVFILNVVDGFTMLSMMFENGTNVFMSRFRLYDDDSEGLVRNILDNLSGLIQFNKSERFSDITHSYYLGLSERDIELMSGMNPYPDIKLASIDIFNGVRGREKLGKEAHFVYLDALSGNAGINLMRSYKTHGRRNKQSKPVKAWPFAVAALLLAAAVPFGYFVYQYTELNKSIIEINEYLAEESIVRKSEELAAVIEETDYYNDISNQLQKKIADDMKKTNISSDIADLITGTLADGITVDRFEYDENMGTVTVSARGRLESDAAEYTSMLGRSRLIEEIQYTGYSSTNDGEYGFTLKITLIPGSDLK